MASFTPRGKNPLYPLDRKLGGSQSRSGRCGEKKKKKKKIIPAIAGNRTPVIQPVVITTLSYNVSLYIIMLLQNEKFMAFSCLE
jgi:hypothetical protein